MKSCNACSDNQASNNNNNNNNNMIVRNVMEVPGTIRVHDIEIPGKIDPTLSHRQWVEGVLPDFDPNLQNLDSCKIKTGPNGKLLSRIALSNENELNSDPSISKIRLFCGTYTMEANHMGNVQALRRTWGKRCDGWVAFSTKDDPNIPALAITHEGEESYNNMWQKSRSIWRYVGAHYMDDFDWFLLGGDDMYYIVENLRYYLGSKEIQEKSSQEPMFVGRRFFPPGQKVFNSGGAGYLLNRASLKILFDNIDTNPKCYPHQHGFWEDVNVANCLFQSAGILPYDTRDSLKRERFHPFTPGQHLEYQAPPDGNDWYVKYNPELKFGFECCSDKSISFHYAKVIN
jgi:glycoprotein-N-acetylgalactosamine 3-beta-galactosyltransferase